MTDDADDITRSLTRLDPTLRDAPPAPGSPRYNAILERAMQSTITRMVRPTTTSTRRKFRKPMRWAAVGAGIAAAAVAVAVVVPNLGGRPQSAQAAVLAAADRVGTVQSFRSHSTSTSVAESESRTSTVTIASNGSNLQRHETKSTGGEETVWLVDGKGFMTVGADVVDVTGALSDRARSSDFSAGNLFAKSSEALVRTAMIGDKAAKVDQSQVRGVSTTHYRITLTAEGQQELAKIHQKGLFNSFFKLNLEPKTTESLDLWIDDDSLIRRLDWKTAHASGRDEFFDFGQPIAITAPTVTRK